MKNETIPVFSPTRRRKSIMLFILIAFGIPWAGWIAALTIARHTSYAGMLFYFGSGCSLAGLIATWYFSGFSGLINLFKRSVNPIAPVFWWLYVILIPILWLVLSYLIYGITREGIGPINLAGFAGYGTAGALFFWLTGSLGEEFGWRGFFLPRLLEKYSPLRGAIILGAVWALWHAPLYYQQWLTSPFRAVNFLIGVTGFSAFITAVYIGSRGNILLCMFMHWMINASQAVIPAVFPALGFTLALGQIQLVVQLIITAVIVWYFKLWRKTTQNKHDATIAKSPEKEPLFS